MYNSALQLTSANVADTAVWFLHQLLRLYHVACCVQVNVLVPRLLMNCFHLSLKASWGSDTVLS